MIIIGDKFYLLSYFRFLVRGQSNILTVLRSEEDGEDLYRQPARRRSGGQRWRPSTVRGIRNCHRMRSDQELWVRSKNKQNSLASKSTHLNYSGLSTWTLNLPLKRQSVTSTANTTSMAGRWRWGIIVLAKIGAENKSDSRFKGWAKRQQGPEQAEHSKALCWKHRWWHNWWWAQVTTPDTLYFTWED